MVWTFYNLECFLKSENAGTNAAWDEVGKVSGVKGCKFQPCPMMNKDVSGPVVVPMEKFDTWQECGEFSSWVSEFAISLYLKILENFLLKCFLVMHSVRILRETFCIEI